MAKAGQKTVLSSIIAASLLSAGIFGYYLGNNSNSAVTDAVLYDSISDALENDEVIIRVHDSAGNLKLEQKKGNIITSAGAIYFCVQMNRCESHITNESPNVQSVAGPTWWVQFISGTANTGKPTGADCTAPSGGGDLAGVVSGGRCITDFGALPAQYQATGGAVITVSNTAGTGQLRGTSGTYDTTNQYVRTTEATVCSIVNDGSGIASGTCQFTDTTPVLTNMSGGSITVSGLALAGGDGSTSTAGILIIAESDISDVVLANGDTISVSWTIVT